MKKVKLGEVLSLKKGKKATVLAEQTTLSQRYIQIDDLRNNNNLKFTESLNMTEALPDDILIAWDGANAGTVGYGLSGAVGSTITVLKKNERYKEKIISDYLGVFLESKSQYLREHSTGATIPHLNKNILLDLQLELLGIEEQENIICILNTIKRLITKRKLQLDELNLLVKSRFNEMFGENKIFESIDNLFDIIDGDRGKNYPKSDELFSEEYCLFLNTKNVTKNGFSFDTKQFITKTKDKLLRKGKLERYDIVLTTRGTVGNVAYYDELIKYKYLRINSGMVILRPKTPNLNQKFIIHVLRNNNYSRVISGSAQPQLPITKLKNLNTIKRLITKRKLQLDELNLLVKSRFNEMFEEYPDSVFLDTYIKELRAGKSLAGEENNKNKVLKTGAVSYDYFNSSEVKNLPIDYIPLDEHKVEIGDVIISRMNTSELVGAAGYVWAINSDNIYLPDRLWKVILNDRVNPVFLWKLITNEKTKLKIKRISSGTSGSMKNISKSQLLQIRVPFPPLALQNEFADFVALVDKSQLAIQKSLEELETLKKSLMQEYFG
ncbi:type I restriction-modification system, S subunit, putative [Streptococcus pneumoniae]|nr:type I restriction-modification system, S subunit, putative [Streptococcus pneumoniae]